MKTRTEIIVETERWIIVKRPGSNESGFQDYPYLHDDPVNPENLDHPVASSVDKEITPRSKRS